MSVTTTIGGVSYGVVPGSLKVGHVTDQQDQCSFDIIEPTGTVTFSFRQPVTITDSTLGLEFSGVISKPEMTLLWPSVQKRWTITCVDQTYRLAKRSSNKIYANQQAGVIAADQIQRYAATEHVSGAFALDWRELQTEWQGGTVSGTVVAANASDGNPGDGDVELASAGSQVVATGSSTTFTQHNGLKLTGYCSSGYATAYVYRQIWSGSLVIANLNRFFYDVWISSSSPSVKAAVIFICADGTVFQGTLARDSQWLPCDSGTDLSGLAQDQWYTRPFFLTDASLVGNTLVSVAVALSGTNAGTYTAYFRRIFINQGGGTTMFFGDSSTLQMNAQIANIGYSNVSLTPVSLSDKSVVVTQSALSISAASIVRNSQIAWSQTLPTGATALRETSIDAGASWQTATSGNAIVNLLAGMSVGSRTVTCRDTLTLGQDPTAICSIGAPTVTVNPSYASTKTDVVTSYTTATQYNTGTLTNLKTVGSTTVQGITINGIQRNWDDGFFGNQPQFGTGSPSFQQVENKQMVLQTGNNSEIRSQLQFAGQWQNFIAEVDITVVGSGNTAGGFVYRTTGWQNANDTYAYIAMLSETTLVLGRGTNTGSGGGGFTNIATATVALTANTAHRLKIVINGSSHQLYVDGVLLITATDATWGAAGYLGLRFSNGSGATSQCAFDNFGVCSALSGTWQSPAISLTSATTYGSSNIFWDVDGLPDSTTSITAQTSIDGGSTFQSVTNGGAISGLTAGTSLSGKTVILLLTLTASNAPVVPGINGVTAWVMGQYSSSGTWTSTALALATVGRAAYSLVNWNALTPTGTSLAVATSVNGGSTYQTVAAAGNAIANITLAPSATVDTFATNTSANYTTTFGTGGSAATWTWDVANSRMKAVGGSKAVALVNGLTVTDVDMFVDLWQSQDAGMVWRWVDASNYYELVVRDSGGSTPNTMTLNKIAAGTLTQLATGSITFPTQTHHYARVTMLGTAVVCYFDGVSILTATDSALASGSAGVKNATGTSYFYNLDIQPQGQNVVSTNVITKLTLTSTDATVTPQVLDLQTFVGASTFGTGALVATATYNTDKSYISSNLDDLKNKCGNYWWSIAHIVDANGNYPVTFQPRTATPAPWPLDEGNSQTIAGQSINDILLNGIKVSYSADLYRNRQTLKNAIAKATFTQTFFGDGQTRTWNVANPLAAPPTAWKLNGLAITIGINGVDSGKNFYYQIGSTALTQDSGGTILQITDSFTITYVGSYLQDVTYNNTALTGTLTQSALAAITSDSGIVESVIDVASENMSVAAATAYAQQLCAQYGVAGLTFPFVTLRSGLAIGQQLAIYAPDLNLNDIQAFISGVSITQQLAPAVAGGILFGYAITVQTGPALPASAWVKLLASGLSR